MHDYPFMEPIAKWCAPLHPAPLPHAVMLHAYLMDCFTRRSLPMPMNFPTSFLMEDLSRWLYWAIDTEIVSAYLCPELFE